MIRPFQHLFVVIGIMCIMVIITYMEHNIELWTSHADKFIFNPFVVNNLHNILNNLTVCIDNDYKRSNLRRLIKRAKQNVNYFLK